MILGKMGKLPGELAPEIVALAKEKGINIQFYDRSKLDAMAPGIRHQGVLAQVPPVQYAELEDILQIARDRNEPPFIVLLDELEDPHNLGAILRTADAAGVHGVLIPKGCGACACGQDWQHGADHQEAEKGRPVGGCG